jgi:prepilin-type N-terminal cleavage/methylation domain-containing protein
MNQLSRQTLPHVTHRNNAFTLVELAIVIVIIGLLVGGVLQGQELITQAKIRAQIKQLAEYDTAIISFKGKYGFLPGDIPYDLIGRYGLVDRYLGNTNIHNGNGLVNDSAGSAPMTHAWGEALFFFRHLEKSKLIKASFPRTGNQYAVGLQFPLAKLGNGGFLYTSMADGNLYAFLGLNKKDDDAVSNIHNMAALSIAPLLSTNEAFGIDDKIDDGNPLLGKVRAVTVNASNFIISHTTSNECITNTTDQKYNFVSEALQCRLVIQVPI